MKKILCTTNVAILVISFAFVAFPDSVTNEAGMKSVGIQATAKFEYLNPATQTNQTGVPAYQKIFNVEDIDLVSGSVDITQTDIKIPGRNGLDLIISRTYNSRHFSCPAKMISDSMEQRMELVDKKTSPEDIVKRELDSPKNDYFYSFAGLGWEFNLGARLIAITYDCEKKDITMPSDQVLVQIDNSSMRFEEKDGVFRSADKGIDHIVKMIDDTYVLFDTGGNKYYFKDCFFERYFNLVGDIPDQHMKERYLLLDKIEDPNGNSISFKNISFGNGVSGEVSVNRSKMYIPTLVDIQIKPGFTAKDIPLTLGSIWVALINPLNWIAGIILFNIDQLQTKEYHYTEIAGYKYTPIRPGKIIDTCERTFNIKYNNDGQISSMDYLDPKNGPISIGYDYENGALTKVMPPEGNPLSFIYRNVNQGLEDGFDDKGPLLTEIAYPSGAIIIYDHSWFSPDTTELKDKKDFSFYVIKKKKMNNDEWDYQYSGGYIYNKHCGDPADGNLWTFEGVKVTDPLGNIHSYKLTDNLMTAITDPLCAATTYHWDLERKLKVADITTHGNRICKQYYKYDQYGNCTEINDLGDISLFQDDRTILFEYESNAELNDKNILNKIERSSIGAGINRYCDTKYSYDGKGNLTLINRSFNGKDAANKYRYDIFGNLTTMIDPLGSITTLEYSNEYKNAYLTKKIAGGLSECFYYYFNSGLLIKELDNNDLATSYLYDRSGRLIQRTSPDGSIITYHFDDDTNNIEYRNEKDIPTIYSFDNLGRTIGIEASNGSSINYSYDSLSRLIAKVDTMNRRTNYQYDPAGRMNRIIYPDGSSKRFEYQDNKIIISDELNNKWTYFIDGRANIIRVIEPNDRSVKYEFDCLDNMVKAIDQKYLTTDYKYDDLGDILKILPPDGSSYKYEYDLPGRTIKRIDGNGGQTEYKYDALNRPTNIAHPDPEDAITNTYDKDTSNLGIGKLSTVKDMTGNTKFDYDEMGRTVAQTKTINNIPYRTNYKYDKLGNIIEIEYPMQYKVTYVYDEVNSIKEAILSSQNDQTTLAHFEYYPNKTVKKIEYSNNISQAFEYDQRDRVKRILIDRSKEDVLLDHTYQYDICGNLISFQFSPQESLAYEYDNLGRLIRVKYPTEGDSVYSYDASGNRTLLKYAYGEINYLYNAQTDRLESYKINGIETKLRYDACGNQIEEADPLISTKFKYDRENRPADIATFNHNPNHHLAFLYDFKGLMGQKTGDNSVEIYHYDLYGNLIAKTDPEGQPLAYYVYANGYRICKIEPQGELFFYLNDQWQNPLLIVDQNGTVLNRYLFDPFGSIFAAKEKKNEEFNFTGKEALDIPDVYHFGERLYDPITGRFLGKDKQTPDHLVPATLNRYVYCLNNPYKFVDPDALETYLVHGIWAGNLQDVKALKDSLVKNGVPDVYVFEWSKRRLIDMIGDLGEVTGELLNINNSAASRLADYIKNNHKAGEPINIVCHSAGGSISINAAEILGNKYKLKVDSLFMMAAPIGSLKIRNIDKAYNMLSISKNVLSLGNSPIWDLAFPAISSPSYLVNGDQIQHIYFNNIGHTGWFSSSDVEGFLLRNIER